jgi:hypothetical protein
VQTKEGNSPDWISIGEAVQKTLKPIKQIAREWGVSDTAVHKQMKKQGWRRPEAPEEPSKPDPQPPRKPATSQLETAAKALASASVPELTGRGRGVILNLMAELEFLNANHETLVGMVEDYVNGERDGSERSRLIKLLNHESRCKSANYLATALAKLNDAAPGKKEQARVAAEEAGQNSGWGDDLDAGTATNGRPN